MKKRSRTLLFLGIFFFIAVLMGFSIIQRIFVPDAAGKPSGVPVQVTRPWYGSIERSITYSGTLKPWQSVTVFSRIPGKIDRFSVKKGERVRENQLLIYVKDETINPKLDQAYAAWQAAEAQYEKAVKGVRPEELENARALVLQAEKDLELAEENFNRTKRLFNEGSLPKVKYDEAENQFRSAKTAVENAKRSLRLMEKGASAEELNMARANASAMKAQYELVRLQADFKEVLAPITGLVADIFVDAGNMVNPSTPIMLIVQDNPIEAAIALPEKYYTEIGQDTNEKTVYITANAVGETRVFEGRITNVAPLINPQNRTFELDVEINNDAGYLRPGMYVNARIILEACERTLLIPAHALLVREAKKIVFSIRLEDDKSGQPPLQTPEALLRQSRPKESVRNGEGTVHQETSPYQEISPAQQSSFRKTVLHWPEEIDVTAAEKEITLGLQTASCVQVISGITAADILITEGNTFLENGQLVKIMEELEFIKPY